MSAPITTAAALAAPIATLARDLLTRNTAQRRALARAITLIESSRAADSVLADNLLNHILPHTGKALRIGISGVPGAGKSTFIEALGLHITTQGGRVAVLAVDPSSPLSGGSILGDKTRMEGLAQNPQAFIRPSPSGGTLGGVAQKTRETLLLCEAAGYDTVLIETVGTGQSETAVHSMCDVFVLLQLPNAGDELQAMKRGVMELADLVVINKADLDAHAANRARAHIASTLAAVRRPIEHDNTLSPTTTASPLSFSERVLCLSSSTGAGIDIFWQTLTRFHLEQQDSGQFRQRRQQQNQQWLWQTIDHALKAHFLQNPKVQAQLARVQTAVIAGDLAPSAAARQLLQSYQQKI